MKEQACKLSLSNVYLIISCRWFFLLKFDMHERGDARPTDWTCIILHPDDLTTPLAQAKMSTWKYYCVFESSKADDTLSLRFISHVCCCVVFAENVIKLEYCLVIQKLLLHKFILIRSIWLLSKCSIGELNWFLCSAFVRLREDCFNSNHNWIVIISETCKVFSFILF